MKNVFISLVTAGTLFAGVQLAGCGKESDNFTSDAVTDYVPMQVGKYILYRYDSLQFTDRGQSQVTVTYHAKDVVEAAATDNQGRSGWRVVRYLRDTASKNEDDWRPIVTYMATPTANNLETNEGAFRYIKLTTPIRDGRSWKGNGYLPDNPYVSLYEFSNDEDIHDWDYAYQDVGASLTLLNKNYDSTISVLQIADSSNVPIQAGVPASKSYWIEKYAKNIGLVYREVEMWEYQPPTTMSGYRQGFGIKMTIIDHN